MPNRLAAATSPYLRQHAENPVDWYPWSPEALQRARVEEKPILLSIGYAACHWCHVMAHESFEDESTARLMNEHFVSIKVDREERPDLDAIYMQAVQALTGQGGWPMTVFLTPEGEPFYGGTYYPPHDRHGLPSFRRVLNAVHEAWRDRRDAVTSTARGLREALVGATRPRDSSGEVDARTLELAFRGLARSFDARQGGFGDAPKFPPSMALDFLLRYWGRTGNPLALEMVTTTFRTMGRGGIYDQVGGGLHRYSVDARWLVPHFEKMLYDNALLARLGVHLWQATGDDEVRSVTERTLDWAVREMRSPSGGFYSSLDADSEEHEGRFYLWDSQELDSLLGQDAEVVRTYWGVSPGGNFEGLNILHVPHDMGAVAARSGRTSQEIERIIAAARERMYVARSARVWPGLDDKVVASWNGLMVRAFAAAARAFVREDYRDVALTTGEFLSQSMMREGRVLRSMREAVPGGPGVLEDHASLGLAFVDLYFLTFDREWLRRATTLADSVVEHFFDEEAGVFYDTARDHEALILRPRDVTDNALPAGTSLAAELLLLSAELDGDDRRRELAEYVVRQSGDLLGQAPNFFGHLLGVADMTVHGAVEVAVAGEPMSPGLVRLLGAVNGRYVPSLVVAAGTDQGDAEPVALLRGRRLAGDVATAYVCRRYLCDAPTTDPETLMEQLERAARAPR
ncbi:MAG TPA: thioredoxin domain-containing protein [Gemmatimonadaceae bacterium]|nr:thioredoxin domain-containing protein [Gemmatimonadaceae bacterium]